MRYRPFGRSGAAISNLTLSLGFDALSRGPDQAKELIYSGRFVSGEEAYALGLATEVLPSDEVLPRARALARELAVAPSLALVMAKRQFAEAQSQTYAETLALERTMQPLMVRTEDFAEGTSAFREQRKPQYKGR